MNEFSLNNKKNQISAIIYYLLFAVLFGVNVLSLEIVSRNDWGAKPPKAIEWINETVPFVIIHHSYIPSACYSMQNCSEAMRGMQRFHQDDQGWADIGYTYVKSFSCIHFVLTHIQNINLAQVCSRRRWQSV